MKEYHDPALEHSHFSSSYDAERSNVYDDVDPFGREEGHQVNPLGFQLRITHN
jgi:hypothetical protein